MTEPPVAAAAVRVLHVAHQAPPHIGGIETVIAAETCGLRDRGWSVTLATSADTVSPGTRDEDGVRTVRMRSWNGLEQRFGVPFPFFSPGALLRLRREVRRADVVHLHDAIYLSSWVAAAWCLLHRTPYVVTRHVGVVHHPSALVRFVQWVVLATAARVVLSRATFVLPIDEHIAAEVRAGGVDASRVKVLGNGVDTTRFHPGTAEERDRTRAAYALPLERLLVLFVGRPVPKKGFDMVAAAVSEHYDIAFVGGEVGVGPDGPGLHFVGPVAAAAMPAVYRCADLMVIASVGECPLTVLEAMGTGLPVVVNDDPALHSPWTEDAAAGEVARFVDMARGQLPTALSDLVADVAERERLGTAAREHVRDSFSWTAHVERLVAIYERAMSERARAARIPGLDRA